jgi:nucleoid DNA-binding protein
MAKDKKPAPAKKVALPKKYTGQTMAQYLAEKHDISKKQAKEMIDDLFELVGQGVLAGERVPLGTMGKVFVRVRPATKARLGRNPLTGQEITIPAKKETKVPRASFAKGFKESVLKAKVKK